MILKLNYCFHQQNGLITSVQNETNIVNHNFRYGFGSEPWIKHAISSFFGIDFVYYKKKHKPFSMISPKSFCDITHLSLKATRYINVAYSIAGYIINALLHYAGKLSCKPCLTKTEAIRSAVLTTSHTTKPDTWK